MLAFPIILRKRLNFRNRSKGAAHQDAGVSKTTMKATVQLETPFYTDGEDIKEYGEAVKRVELCLLSLEML